MQQVCRAIAVLWTGAAVLFHPANDLVHAADNDPETQRQLQLLRQQNDSLQQQMRRQAELIDELSRKVSDLDKAARDNEPRTSTETTKGEATGSPRSSSGFSLGKVHLSGEGGAGFFHSQPQGQFPNSEFRVDEAKLFVEAPIWGEVYFFSEINLFTREEGGPNLKAGELYLDAENLSRLWGQDHQLNLRLGRIDIPFGEEYLTRDAIDNPDQFCIHVFLVSLFSCPNKNRLESSRRSTVFEEPWKTPKPSSALLLQGPGGGEVRLEIVPRVMQPHGQARLRG